MKNLNISNIGNELEKEFARVLKIAVTNINAGIKPRLNEKDEDLLKLFIGEDKYLMAALNKFSHLLTKATKLEEERKRKEKERVREEERKLSTEYDLDAIERWLKRRREEERIRKEKEKGENDNERIESGVEEVAR